MSRTWLFLILTLLSAACDNLGESCSDDDDCTGSADHCLDLGPSRLDPDARGGSFCTMSCDSQDECDRAFTTDVICLDYCIAICFVDADCPYDLRCDSEVAIASVGLLCLP